MPPPLLSRTFRCEVQGRDRGGGGDAAAPPATTTTLRLTLTEAASPSSVALALESLTEVFFSYYAVVSQQAFDAMCVEQHLASATAPRSSDVRTALPAMVSRAVDSMAASSDTRAAVFSLADATLHFVCLLDVRIVDVLTLEFSPANHRRLDARLDDDDDDDDDNGNDNAAAEEDLARERARIQARFDEVLARAERAEAELARLKSYIRVKRPALLEPPFAVPVPSSQQTQTQTQ